jgi:aspartyl-tRNA(Asn)/glutamyl-tRNA(Gln) amidotransferase subunit C
MAVNKKEVEVIAELARLRLNENEIDYYTAQLNQILEYVDKLNELNIESVEPLHHPVEGKNALREDVRRESVSTAEALKNAPDKDENFFKVPKVIQQV